jgi:hypothetical protein
VKDLIAAHAKKEPDKATATALSAMAESTLLWPDDALFAKVSFGRELTTDDERSEWDSIFLPISES